MARPHAHPVGILEGPGVDLHGALEAAVPEVACGEVPCGHPRVHGRACAVGVHAPGLRVYPGDEGPGEPRDLFEVGGFGWAVAPDGDALEFLGPHDGTQPAPARDVVEVVYDAGYAGLLLAPRSYEGRPGALVPDFLPHPVLALGHLEAPEARGVPELCVPVVHPEPDRLLGCPCEDDLVESGGLELGLPEAARVGLAESPGQRRLGSDGVSA